MDSQSATSDESDAETSPTQLDRGRDPTSVDTASTNHQLAEDPSDQQTGSAGQKRRRVTRACDECRRKKIKCDGKQPCTHCTVYSYDCTYDQPSHRRRNPAPQYIEALETRLARSEAIIRMYLPNLDPADPNLDQMLQQQGSIPLSRPQFGRGGSDKSFTRINSNDPTLEAMIDSTGQLDLDEKGRWDYVGGSSGLSFVRGVRDRLCDPGLSEDADNKLSPQDQQSIAQLRVPTPPPYVGEEPATLQSPYDSASIGTDQLPDRDLARNLCVSALEDATAILNPVHQPSFYYRFDRIYDLPPDQYDNDDHSFLPLLYAVIALGCLFATDNRSELELKGYKSAIGVGFKYFWAARQLMDVTDCRDVTSLQAIVFMIMFLQCSAKLSTCYSFVGVALRSALRMGLHRSFKNNFSPVDNEIRKRVFWVIRKMDIYVAAMLGLPQTLNDEDIDQEFPTEVDDERITSDGIMPMPEGTLSLMAAANANFRLARILCKIVRNIYPIKSSPTAEGGPTRPFSVSYAKIREIEMDLQRWQESLPSQLQPGEQAEPQKVRQQLLLRMGYAFAQMMLYRPFLHYVSARNQLKSVNQRAYTCAAACISVSRNVVHITADMKKRGLLEGSYWFVMYTQFHAVLSLAFFALENPESPTREDAVKHAKEGKETLARLARRSMAADRCSSTLKVLFEQIGDSFERSPSPQDINGRKPSAAPKKTVISQKISKASKENKTPAKRNSPNGVSASQRGNSAPRQRGMRLISQTGRPAGQKQQQQQQHNQQAQVQPSPTQQPPNMTRPQDQPLPQLLHHHQPQSASQIPTHPNMTPNNFYMSSSPTSAAIPTNLNSQLLQQQNPYNQQQPFQFVPGQLNDIPYSDGISNLSNMMFPSDNPFHYPNQPMTALEQNLNIKSEMYQQHQPHQGIYIPPAPGGPHPSVSDEHIDAQPFGQLSGYGSNSDVNMAMEHPQHMNPANTQQMWEQQAQIHGLYGMDLDGSFGEDEWRG